MNSVSSSFGSCFSAGIAVIADRFSTAMSVIKTSSINNISWTMMIRKYSMAPLLILSLLLTLSACTVEVDPDAFTPFDPVAPQAAAPQYGGSLNVGTVYVTLSALSWDPADWAWKQSHDSGLVREQLFAANLDLRRHKGGPYPFTVEAHIPDDALRGELAKSWSWEQSATGTPILVIKLRQGIMFAELPGIMKARELDAEDVVFSYNLSNNSPRKIGGYFDHIDSVVARDSHTVVFHFNQYHAEWAYRFGYGIYSTIIPRETADIDRHDWRNVVGTGPFTLENYIHGNSHSYKKNPDYWDSEQIAGKPYTIPFVDEVNYRVIKDEATYLTAIRTAKVDILETIRWLFVDHLKASAPELRWSKRLYETGTFMAMRVDQKPFDDVRVRRAMNLAINQQQIVERYYGGNAELLAYPEHPEFGDYYKPLAEMPVSVQALFDYQPDEARKLLAEAGYPDGFSFRVQFCSCNPNHRDLLPLLASYLSDVGVQMEIEPMEYASFLSMMTTRQLAPGYMLDSSHTNPTTSLRKSFTTGQTWNPSQYSDPAFDEKMRQVYLTRDEATRQRMIREMTVEILDQAPYIWLPTPYVYTAWWPWVQNYGGELRAGGNRPGPIYSRIWIDHAMKKQLGFE